MHPYIAEVLEQVARRNAGEPEFLQAAREVLESLAPVFDRHRHYRDAQILERIVEPERQILFRVPWQDDTGRLRVNADSGYGFDFSPRVDNDPDSSGTFGGTLPSIGSQAGGPFDLSGQTFPVSFTVTTGTTAAPVTSTVTRWA